MSQQAEIPSIKDNHHRNDNCEIGNKSKVRKMDNGNWAIPFSCGFNIIKVHSFDADAIAVRVDFEMIIHIKFTGCPDIENLMLWCIENLRCRVNDEEMDLLDTSKFAYKRCGSWKLLKS